MVKCLKCGKDKPENLYVCCNKCNVDSKIKEYRQKEKDNYPTYLTSIISSNYK